jgi:hypothetical protein
MKKAACLETEHDGLMNLSLEEMLIALQMYKIWLDVIKLYLPSANYNVLKYYNRKIYVKKKLAGNAFRKE